MPFTIDEDSLLIRGRKGDTASFYFHFDEDISDCVVNFYIKQNITSNTMVITKTYTNPTDSSITVNLTTDDTSKLESNGANYKVYYWGLKVTKGTDYVETVVPKDFHNIPMMYIYPKV